MARFKLVKIGRRKVEVQKVRFKVNLGVLLGSFLCAVFVWMYLTGRGDGPVLFPPKDDTPHESEVTDVADTDAATCLDEATVPTYGGSAREA